MPSRPFAYRPGRLGWDQDRPGLPRLHQNYHIVHPERYIDPAIVGRRNAQLRIVELCVGQSMTEGEEWFDILSIVNMLCE